MKKSAVLGALCALLLLAACGAPESAEEKRTRIELEGAAIQVTGGGAKAAGSVVTISAGGSYVVTGSLDNGQLIVDTGDDAMDVWLMLDNASITNLDGAAIEVRQAKNVYLSTLPATKNLLVSGTEEDLARFDGTQNGAVILSEDDLSLSGEGELEIRGYINNGITCKDDLDIEGGTLTVFAASHGLRGSESVELKGGSVTVTARGDGVRSTSAKKEGKGYVSISGGVLTVTAQGDGIQAETDLSIAGGIVAIAARGDGLEQSSKALKAGADIRISGGELTLSSVEDAVRGGGNVAVTGGTLRIDSRSDGVQAGKKDSGAGDLVLGGGRVTISAGQRALRAYGVLRLEGATVAAYIGSAKQGEPAEGGQAYLLEPVSGEAGDRLSLDGADLGLEAAFSYLAVLYSDSALSPGSGHTLTTGARTLHVRTK